MSDDQPPIEPTPDEPAPVVRGRRREGETTEDPTQESTDASKDTELGGAPAGDLPRDSDADAEVDDTDATDTDATDTDDDDGPVAPVADPAGRARVVLAAVAVLVIAAIGWALFGRGEETAAPRPTVPTTTTIPTTATTQRPAGISKMATAKAGVTTVTVLSSAPPGWDTATPVEAWQAQALPASQDSMPARPALPRLDYKIQGRYATPTGWEFSNPTSFGGPLTFLVTEVRGNWAKVLLPVRPNDTEGWVSLNDIDISDTDYRVELHVGDHRLVAYKGSEVIADTPVVVGKDATRTPTGRFFITDKVTKQDPSGAYGPFILPLSAYSEQLDVFDDGVPVIAMHGTNQPALLGQNASNGCIRLPNDVITTLHDQLPLGTQVEVFA